MENLKHHLLSNLNFDTGTGIDLPMLNDVDRNLFYRECLRDCKDKVVLDLGAGTGFLSAMAVGAGAKHVYSFEKDKHNFELAKHLIEKSDLQDKISLYHVDILEFNPSGLDPIDVLVTDTIANDFFIQRFSILTDYVINNFKLGEKFYCIPNNVELCARLVECDQNNHFSPGVDLPNNFSQNLNSVIKLWKESYTPKAQLYQDDQTNVDQTQNCQVCRLDNTKPITDDISIGKFAVDGNMTKSISEFKNVMAFDTPKTDDTYLEIVWKMNSRSSSMFTLNKNTHWQSYGFKIDHDLPYHFTFQFNNAKFNLFVSQT